VERLGAGDLGSLGILDRPRDTALCTLVGWNIEIMFMFAIAGILF
jgi:hypothetical protein